MKKTRKFTALLLAAVMALAVMIPIGVAAQDRTPVDRIPVTIENLDLLREVALDGQLPVDIPTVDVVEGQSIMTIDEARARGRIRMPGDLVTISDHLEAAMPNFQAFGASQIVELEVAGLTLTVDFNNIETIEVDLDNFDESKINLLADALANDMQINIVDQADLENMSQVEVEPNDIRCRLFGCSEFRWVWVTIVGWGTFLGLQCVRCGTIFF